MFMNNDGLEIEKGFIRQRVSFKQAMWQMKNILKAFKTEYIIAHKLYLKIFISHKEK